MAMAGMMVACTDVKVEAPELPDLPTVSNLKASVANRVVTLDWSLPTTSLGIEGVTVKVNNSQEIYLEGERTQYNIMGQPMEDEYMYTIKVNYRGGYVSPGQTVFATVPYVELANVTDLEVVNIEGRTVTLAWNLPDASGITGVYVGLDGNDITNFQYFEGNVETVTLTKQPNGQHVNYRVCVQYDNAYTSSGEVCPADVEYVESKVGFLLLGDSLADLEDDDEKAAAAWYQDNYVATEKGVFIPVADLPNIEFDEYGMIWIMVDRVGLDPGWKNLPASLVSTATINALKEYGAQGGNLYLSNMATQLTVPLEFVPESMPVNIFGSGAGDPNNGDLWSINPHLGWVFQDINQYYDRASHAVYAGLEFEMVNGYEYSSLPLEGGMGKEDHNSMWDLNPYWHEAGDPAPNCVAWWENTTNSQVLAVWGQVGDHCVAGMVDFKDNDVHGRCIAMGLGAYEWNVNGGVNPYQGNIEKLTENIINYLK